MTNNYPGISVCEKLLNANEAVNANVADVRLIIQVESTQEVYLLTIQFFDIVLILRLYSFPV